MQQDALVSKIISGLAKLSEASKAGATPQPSQKLFGSPEDIQKFLESMEGALAKLPNVAGLGRGVVFGNMTETAEPKPQTSTAPEVKTPEAKPEPAQTPVPTVSIVLAKLLAFSKHHKPSHGNTNRLDVYEDKAILLRDDRNGFIAALIFEKDDFIALSLELSFIDAVSKNIKAWLGERGHVVYSREALRLLLTEDEIGDVESIDVLRLLDKEGKMGIHIAVNSIASNGGLDKEPCDILSDAQKFFDRIPNASSVVVQTGAGGKTFAKIDFMVNVNDVPRVEHSTSITENTIRRFANYLYSPALTMPPGLQCEDVRLPNNVMFVITKRAVEEKPEPELPDSLSEFFGQLFKTVEKVLQDSSKV